MDPQTIRLYMVLDSYIAADSKPQAIRYYNANEVGSGPQATTEDVVPVIQQDLLDWQDEGYEPFKRLDAMEADLEKPFLFGRNEQRWDLTAALAGPNPFEAQN